MLPLLVLISAVQLTAALVIIQKALKIHHRNVKKEPVRIKR